MAFRLTPGADIAQSAREIGREQLDRSLSRFSAKSKKGNPVHETRKSMKRLRALLHLIKPAMRKADFRRDEARIKQIARSLSGVRDIQAMLETLVKLEASEPASAESPVMAALREHLGENRDAAEKALTSASLAKTRKLLKEARKSFDELTLQKDDFDVLALTIRTDYRKARRSFERAYELGEDEVFHDWRKYVQRHWRQLLLIAPGWPRAIRPHIALARDLSEVLGDDHDLYVLIAYVDAQGSAFGSDEEVEWFIGLCRKRQADLRALARHMGTRLLAEKPSSLAARLRAYWITAPQLEDANPPADEDGDNSSAAPVAR
jgi:hypothetical protein